MLDIVNIAHPAFIILGSYIAYIVNTRFGIDPIVVSILALPVFYVLGAVVYQVYYLAFEKRGQEALRGLAFFFGVLFITEVVLVLVFGVDYRSVNAPYIGPSLHIGSLEFPLPAAGAVPGRRWRCSLALQIFLSRTFIGRAIMAVSQDPLALRLMAVDPIRIKRIAFGISIATASIAGAFLIIIQPVDPVGRPRLYRPRLRHLRARRPRQPARHADRGAAARRDREPDLDLLRPVLGAGGVVRHPAADAGRAALRPVGTLDRAHAPFHPRRARDRVAALYLRVRAITATTTVFFAGYTVLQYIVLATAWNILGGYCGYVNFGSAGFFASAPIPACSSTSSASRSTTGLRAACGAAALHLPAAGAGADRVRRHRRGLVGLGTGYLTLRLRGVFFAIATLALAVVLQTLVVNWEFVGGSRGAYVIPPDEHPGLRPLYPISVRADARAGRSSR